MSRITELRQFRDSLKPGDTFAQVRGNFCSFVVWLTVARRTATQIVMTNGERYNAKTGYRIGKGSYFLMLPPSNEVMDELEAYKEKAVLAGKMIAVRWKDIPIEKLRKIVAVLEE